jgi:hypothetical protein
MEVNCQLAMETLFCSSINGQQKKESCLQEFCKLLAKLMNRRNTNQQQEQRWDDAPSTSTEAATASSRINATTTTTTSTTTATTNSGNVHLLVQIPRLTTRRGRVVVP